MASRTLHYQPIFQRNSGAVLYYEALLRDRHTSTPELFRQADLRQSRIPLEREALRLAQQDVESGYLDGKPIGINVSPLVLCEDPASWRILSKIARRRPFFLEVTEDLPVHDHLRYTEKLHKLCALGVELVRDDLGSGYAHFTDMFESPFSYGKLDQRFFHWWFPRTLPEQKRRQRLESLVTFLGQQSCYLIQEGIEKVLNPALLSQLPLPVQGLQGFGLGHPERTPWAIKCPAISQKEFS